MDILEILPDSDPILRKTSRRVTHVDENLKKLITDMYDTMVIKNGIGLSAIQVGVLKRFFVYEIPVLVVDEIEGKPGEKPCETSQADEANHETAPDKFSEATENPGKDESEADQEISYVYTGDYLVCINPRIISKEGSVIDDEGCLSKEGWHAKVERALNVTLQAYDIEMKKFVKTVSGLEARCVQHEIDHLDGILFTDRAEEGTLREVTDTENGESEEPSTASNDNESEIAQEHVITIDGDRTVGHD
ncbi:peptide deformylase [bacterium]|nr:peptide deformylase [bacterium]